MIKGSSKKIMILVIALLMVTFLSFTYAFFSYDKDSENIPFNSGSISINFSEGTNNLSLQENYPKSDILGKIEPYYYDFSVSGTKGKENIIYEIQIKEDDINTLHPKYVKLYLTDQDDNQLIEPILLSDLKISEYNNNYVLYTNYIKSAGVSQLYRLRLWIDSEYVENIEHTFNFLVNVYAVNDNN